MSNTPTDAFVTEVLNGEGVAYAITDGWFEPDDITDSRIAAKFEEARRVHDEWLNAEAELIDACLDYLDGLSNGDL